MRVGSLFSGIGGFDLGLERAGMECAWQVEIDPFCRRVLAKHWPDVPRYEDVRDVGAHNLEPVDLVAGGYPCQPFSNAGKRLGDRDDRHLWPEFARVLRELRPKFALLENVTGHLVRGLGEVLGDLAEIGYDAEWDVLPAAAFGSPQRRERVFIIAHYDSGRGEGHQKRHIFNAEALGRDHPDGLGVAERSAEDARARLRGMGIRLPERMDRVRALGNAVVPQVAEWIGRRLMETRPIPSEGETP
jgi:DNA (cytosine-5)-methyltransferase 1